MIAVCGGYQLLGNYYKTEDGVIEGLHLVDIYTEQGEGRLIDNIVLQSGLTSMPVVGFENHGGRTFIVRISLLGKSSTDMETTGRADMKVWYTKM